MTEQNSPRDAAGEDTRRAIAAVKEILDGRDPQGDFAAVMVTLEHAVAVALLAVMGRQPRKAAALLNEGLAPGVERRLSHYEARRAP